MERSDPLCLVRAVLSDALDPIAGPDAQDPAPILLRPPSHLGTNTNPEPWPTVHETERSTDRFRHVYSGNPGSSDG